ncbi:MAG TPA: hypothetical protein VI582_04495, partial [Aestuariivirga sp.]|nr:hypothetical protein [Aestuariivirga sp.]
MARRKARPARKAATKSRAKPVKKAAPAKRKAAAKAKPAPRKVTVLRATPNRKKFTLSEERIPKRWYNIAADLPKAPPPVLHPGTLKPVGPDDLAPLFPMALIMQEVSTDRDIEIP